MTPAELIKAGEALYGPKHWKAPLCRRLKISTVTLWRYLQSKEVPEQFSLAVKRLLWEQGKEF